MQRHVYLDVCWKEEVEVSEENYVLTDNVLCFDEGEIDIAMNVARKILWSGKSVKIDYRFE